MYQVLYYLAMRPLCDNIIEKFKTKFFVKLHKKQFDEGALNTKKGVFQYPHLYLSIPLR